jgi:hypothetical protein
MPGPGPGWLAGLAGALPLAAAAGGAQAPAPEAADFAELLEFLGAAETADPRFDEFFDSLPERPEDAPAAPPVVGKSETEQ